MYNYRPLRDYLETHAMSMRELTRQVGFSTNVGVALNNDKPVTIEILASICYHLHIPIEQVVNIEMD